MINLGFADILDIVVVALILFVAFRWLRGSSAVNIFIAILLLFVIRIVAVAVNMKILSALMDTVIDVGAIALIVIFQPEIRQFLVRVGRSTGIAGGRRGLFDRLLNRSGSNLDPATANEVAWQTARRMVHQIGSAWDWTLIPQICTQYWRVFGLIVLGMLIHWLPARWKRWYRISFAMLPLPVMALFVVAVVFLVYQFITADLQAFIYFQF